MSNATKATIRAAVRASMKGRPCVPKALTRTLVYQKDLRPCAACGDLVPGALFDVDLGLCAACAAELAQNERAGL